MATRSELISICEEIGISYNNLTIPQMKECIRDYIDEKYEENAERRFSIKEYSFLLIKFITTEYSYGLFDKDGNQISKSEILKKDIDLSQFKIEKNI